MMMIAAASTAGGAAPFAMVVTLKADHHGCSDCTGGTGRCEAHESIDVTRFVMT